MKNTNSRRKFLKSAALTAGVFTIVPRFVLGKGYLPPSDKITIGIIGCGKQRKVANRFLSSTKEAEVLACSDLFAVKMEEFSRDIIADYAKHRGKTDHKGVDKYLNYEDLLDRSDIDAVIVATPDHWHAIPAIAAMKKGKHLYCEKPLTHTIKEGRALVNAAKKYKRIVQTGSMQRTNNPDFQHACELVRNGYIGDIKKVEVSVGDPAIPYNLKAEPIPADFDWNRWCGPSPVGSYNHRVAPPSVKSHNFFPDWRQFKEYGGGILSDWGAHMFDIAQWGLGMDHTGPVEFNPPKNPRAVRLLQMKYANGVEMVHKNFGRGHGVRFIGTEGTIDVSRSFLDATPANLLTAKIKGTEIRLRRNMEDHYQDFITAIKTGSTPICDAEVGHRSASVCNLANIAYQLNRPLKWDPVKEKFKGDREANKLRGKKYRKGYKL